ncbi:hypothetical protein DPMN_069251 [Dreissena polymorpha]|uniref:Uncharacterized protein n=1 Tax=Dreissena polymorpha TaxID=45954 RepID=A0A9D4BMX0_DREPO|nr:hypothetical protein DPMN_069251 [Dreissena polymorpha]
MVSYYNRKVKDSIPIIWCPTTTGRSRVPSPPTTTGRSRVPSYYNRKVKGPLLLQQEGQGFRPTTTGRSRVPSFYNRKVKGSIPI